MIISWLPIICFLIFTPSHIYNFFCACSVLVTHWNTKHTKTGGSLYAVAVVVTVIATIHITLGGTLFFIIGLDDNPDAQLVITSLSVLLSFYVSYYHRFSKHLWLKRTLY